MGDCEVGVLVGIWWVKGESARRAGVVGVGGNYGFLRVLGATVYRHKWRERGWDYDDREFEGRGLPKS